MAAAIAIIVLIGDNSNKNMQSTSSAISASTSLNTVSSTTSVSVALSTSSSASTSSIPPPSTQGNGTIRHVLIIVIENIEYSNVIGDRSAPYENNLTGTYALATNYFAVSHPSEPNYIAMIAGSTLNITNDGSVSQNQRLVTNLADLFKAKNVSWRAYEESMPIPCDANDSSDGLYVTKHDPFVYMADITNNLTYCKSHIVNLTRFYDDLANNQLPQYAFITPNIKNDGHDGGVASADGWLSTFIPKIINSGSFNSSVVFLTYDEGTTALGGGGHVATIVIGPSSIVKPGFKSSVAYSHYSLLATIESIYGLDNLGRNDANATTMNDMFVNAG